MLKVTLIAAGGAVGALMRYFVAGWAQSRWEGLFPLGVLVVNLSGCLMIGALGAYLADPEVMREEYRAPVLVGVLGAFTTFSTFGWDTFALLREGQPQLALVNVLSSNLLGLVAVALGFWTVHKALGA